MGNVYLLNYAVRGIKTLDQWISLSFYKKTISNDLDMQKYNIKGIYGMNGSGKSGIVTSVNVLGKLLVDQSYLNNPLVQRNLDAIINKKTGELSIEAEFASKVENIVILYKYAVTLKKDNPYLIDVYLKKFQEGRCVQMLHKGAYNTEINTTKQIMEYITIQGMKLSGFHHEIYLNDPEKNPVDKLKTIVRYAIEEDGV